MNYEKVRRIVAEELARERPALVREAAAEAAQLLRDEQTAGRVPKQARPSQPGGDAKQ